jgi:hypothetical protein
MATMGEPASNALTGEVVNVMQELRNYEVKINKVLDNKLYGMITCKQVN